MTTITEDYCPREIYRLLIGKGFDGEIHTTYDDKGYPQFAITLQMAMKWLREKYNLFIQVTIVPHTTITMEQKYYLFSIHKDKRRLRSDDIPINYYNTYEQAVESAIKYCLENFI